MVSRSPRSSRQVSPGRRRRALADQAHRLGQRRAAHVDRQSPGEQLVEQDAERVDVAAHVEVARVAVGLLGAHVGQGAGEGAAVLADGRRRRFAAGDAGDAEVEHLHRGRAVGRGRGQHHDVRRLEIQVDDAALMRVRDRVADGQADRDARGDLRRACPVAAARAPRRRERRRPRAPWRTSAGRRRCARRRGWRRCPDGSSRPRLSASRRNMRSCWAPANVPARSTFRATVRGGCAWRASKTTPMPPSPRRPRIS